MEEEEREEEGVSVVNESIILVPRGGTRVLTEGKLRWGMGHGGALPRGRRGLFGAILATRCRTAPPTRFQTGPA